MAIGSTTTSNTGCGWPKWPHDVAKAKQLMAEAGYPNGFNYRLADPGAAVLFARRTGACRSSRRSASAAGCRPWSGRLHQAPGRRASRSGPGSTSSLPAPASAHPGPTGTKRISNAAVCYQPMRSASGTSTPDTISTWPRTNPPSASRWPRTIQREHPGELLLRPGVPPRLHERDRPTHRRDEMAGRISELPTTGYAYPWEDIELKA